MTRILKPLAVVAAAGMFVVLVMGSAVTNTGSEHGCGKSWPLCHGQLIPQMAVTTAIEFSHRAVVGIESTLIIALAVLAVYAFRRPEMWFLASLMVVFLFLQAGLGAWAVMAPQLSVVLALHFGVSLIAFASVLLTMVYVFEVSDRHVLRATPVSRAFRRYVWAVAAYSYAVVYLGAYVRHTESDEACRGWPLCNGALLPGGGEKVQVAVGHRIAAGILVLAILALVYWSAHLRGSRPDLYRGSLMALGAVILQAAAGAIVVLTRVDLFSALLHAALAGLTFGALAYLCLQVTTPRGVPAFAHPRPLGEGSDQDALVIA